VDWHRKGKLLRQHRGFLELHATIATFRKVRLDLRALGLVEGAQRVGVDQLFDLPVVHQRPLACPSLACMNVFSFCIPSRILVFTVPSGCFNAVAISC
jgi:hypothetical protein